MNLESSQFEIMHETALTISIDDKNCRAVQFWIQGRWDNQAKEQIQNGQGFKERWRASKQSAHS